MSSRQRSREQLIDLIASFIDTLAGFFAFTGIERYGWAFIAAGVIAKLIIFPITVKQVKSSIAMAKLRPELEKLKKRWGHDRQRFGQEQQQLFRENNVSLMGCLVPTAVQMVLLSMIYFALQKVVRVEGSLPFYFFGDLGDPAGSGVGGWALIALNAFFGVVSARQTAGDDPKQKRMFTIMPIAFSVVLINFPAGVVLYYAVTMAFQYVQQFVMLRHTDLGAQLKASRQSDAAARAAVAGNGKRALNGQKLGGFRDNGKPGSSERDAGSRSPVSALPAHSSAGRKNRNRKRGKV